MKKFACVAMAVFLALMVVTPMSSTTAASGGFFDHLGKKFDFKPIAFYSGSATEGYVDNWERFTMKNTIGQTTAYYGELEAIDLAQDGVFKMARFCFPKSSTTADVPKRTDSFVSANGVKEIAVTFEPNDELLAPRFYELGTASMKVWPDGDSNNISEFRVGSVLVPYGVYTLKLGGKEITRKRVLSWDRTISDPKARFKTTTDTVATTAPAIVGGSSYLPMRNVGEDIFGCNVLWDAATKTATYSYGDGVAQYNVSFVIDKAQATRTLICGDGERFSDVVTMDGAAKLIGGKTMVPLRAISKLMKADVAYNDKTKEVKITYPGVLTNVTNINQTNSTVQPTAPVSTMSVSSVPLATQAITTVSSITANAATTASMQSFLKDVKFFTSVRTGGHQAEVTLFFGYPFMNDVQYADAYIIMSPSRSKVYAWDRIHKYLGRIEFGGSTRPPVNDPESPWYKKFMVSTPTDPNPYRELFNSVSWPWYDTVVDGCTYPLYMLDASRYYIAIELVDPLTGETRTITPFTQEQIYNGQAGVYSEDKLGKYIVDMFDLNKWASDRYKVDSRKEFLKDGAEFKVGDVITIDNVNIRNVEENALVEIGIAYQKNTKEIIPNSPAVGEWLTQMTYSQLKEQGFSFILTQAMLDKFEERLVNEYKKGYIESGKKVEDYGPYSPFGYFIVLRSKANPSNYVRSEGFLRFEGVVTYSQY